MNQQEHNWPGPEEAAKRQRIESKAAHWDIVKYLFLALDCPRAILDSLAICCPCLFMFAFAWKLEHEDAKRIPRGPGSSVETFTLRKESSAKLWKWKENSYLLIKKIPENQNLFFLDLTFTDTFPFHWELKVSFSPNCFSYYILSPSMVGIYTNSVWLRSRHKHMNLPEIAEEIQKDLRLLLQQLK
jgi:hypothetical protein